MINYLIFDCFSGFTEYAVVKITYITSDELNLLKIIFLYFKVTIRSV